jgi:hypothetical protein
MIGRPVSAVVADLVHGRPPQNAALDAALEEKLAETAPPNQPLRTGLLALCLKTENFEKVKFNESGEGSIAAAFGRAWLGSRQVLQPLP